MRLIKKRFESLFSEQSEWKQNQRKRAAADPQKQLKMEKQRPKRARPQNGVDQKLMKVNILLLPI